MEVPIQAEHEKLEKRISITLSQSDFGDIGKNLNAPRSKSLDLRSSTDSVTSNPDVVSDESSPYNKRQETCMALRFAKVLLMHTTCT